MKTTVEALKGLYEKLGGADDVSGLSTKAEMLGAIYTVLGGEENIEGMNAVADMIDLITTVASGGGGGGTYESVYHTEFDVTLSSYNVTETVATIDTQLSSDVFWRHDKILYFKIRRKAGAENAYHYGNDVYHIINDVAGGTASTTYSTVYYRCSSGKIIAGSPNTIGVYVYTVNKNGTLEIKGNKQTNATGSIAGTYTLDFYLIDWVNNDNPFNAI